MHYITTPQVAPLTAAVIVTTPQKLAFIDVAKGVRMFSKLKVSSSWALHGLCNKYEQNLRFYFPVLVVVRSRFLVLLLWRICVILTLTGNVITLLGKVQVLRLALAYAPLSLSFFPSHKMITKSLATAGCPAVRNTSPL